MKKETVKLKNGTHIEGDSFEKEDIKELISLYNKTNDINNCLKSYGGRKTNMSDVISEGIFAYHFNAIRTNNTSGGKSYDCVMKDTGESVQVKSAQIDKDLTSFGPNASWDKLFFMDFSKPNIVDVYEIPSDKLYNKILNKEKNETFKDQQAQGRRPRLSLKKEIINPMQLKPVKTIKLI